MQQFWLVSVSAFQYDGKPGDELARMLVESDRDLTEEDFLHAASFFNLEAVHPAVLLFPRARINRFQTTGQPGFEREGCKFWIARRAAKGDAD